MVDEPHRQELRPHLRGEAVPAHNVVVVRAGQLRDAGFEVLASFRCPHFTVTLGSREELPRLIDALGKARAEPLPWTQTREEVVVIEPGAIVVAGDEDAPAVAEVVEVVEKAAGPVVHLRLLPGAIEDYEALVRRAIAPAGPTRRVQGCAHS